MYTINPEKVFLTAIDKTDFLTESEPECSQTDTASKTEFELPEPLVSLFDPTAIIISNENLKTLCNKKYELYLKAYSIESHKNHLIVTGKQALNPLCGCYTEQDVSLPPRLMMYVIQIQRK